MKKYIYMNILHNWQLQIAAGVRAQRFTSMATGVNVFVGC